MVDTDSETKVSVETGSFKALRKMESDPVVSVTAEATIVQLENTR